MPEPRPYWLAWQVCEPVPPPTVSAADRLDLTLQLCAAFGLPAELCCGEALLLARIEAADREWLGELRKRAAYG